MRERILEKLAAYQTAKNEKNDRLQKTRGLELLGLCKLLLAEEGQAALSFCQQIHDQL